MTESPSLSHSGPSLARRYDRVVGPDECPTQVDREALYRQFQPLVGRLIRRYGRTTELRQDLVGEIYCQFSRLIDHYDPARGIPICAYVPRLSQNVFNYVRDHWRRESRLVHVGEEWQWEELRGAASDAAGSVERLIAEEIRSALPAALERLPHRQRQVVVWRYYEGRSFEEIAAELGVKPATARSLLRHGISGLRKHLQSAGFA